MDIFKSIKNFKEAIITQKIFHLAIIRTIGW